MPTPDAAPTRAAVPAAHHVIAVDDSPDIVALYRAVLADAGCRVSGLPVRDADPDALASLRPDLVLLDYGPWEEGRGWELLRRLRSDPGTSAIPVVVCTGAAAVRPGREDAGPFEGLGVGVLAKPFDIDRLEAEVRARLRASPAHPHP